MCALWRSAAVVCLSFAGPCDDVDASVLTLARGRSSANIRTRTRTRTRSQRPPSALATGTHEVGAAVREQQRTRPPSRPARGHSARRPGMQTGVRLDSEQVADRQEREAREAASWVESRRRPSGGGWSGRNGLGGSAGREGAGPLGNRRGAVGVPPESAAGCLSPLRTPRDAPVPPRRHPGGQRAAPSPQRLLAGPNLRRPRGPPSSGV